MGTPMKFEFDFDEVFEGIKLGVIKEMSEMSFDQITSTAISQVKSEMKNKISLTYTDENEIKKEIKDELKEKIYLKIIQEIKDDYERKYAGTFGRDLTNGLEKAEDEAIEEIKTTTINRLYNNIYSDIQRKAESKINKSISQFIRNISGNCIEVEGKKELITKDEYDALLHRNEILTALEFGGVDNWEWYSESISNYFDEEEEE